MYVCMYVPFKDDFFTASANPPSPSKYALRTIQTHIHIYVHTCPPTYIHACMLTYISSCPM